MPKLLKVVLLSALAVFAFAAVGATTASAHEFFVNGKAIGAGEKIEVQGNQLPGNNQLEGVIAGASVHISCQQVLLPAAKNVLEEKGKLKTAQEYKACTLTTVNGEGIVENSPKCKVANFNAEGSGELTEAGVFSVKGSPFATIKIENSETETCTLKGEYKVETTQECSVPHYSVSVYILLILCTPLGSKSLKLGTEPAKLYASIGLAGVKGQLLSAN